MDNARDQELVARCMKGDRKALGELLTAYEKPIYNAAFRILGNAEDAADVCQLTFLKAFERLDQYKPEFKFFSWIYRIAVNESINQFNRSKHLQGIEDEDEFVDAENPEEVVDAETVSRVLQAGLMKLQEDYRVVVVLRHFSDMSYKDISDVLHIPEKTVKSRLYSARQLMKAQLGEWGMM